MRVIRPTLALLCVAIGMENVCRGEETPKNSDESHAAVKITHTRDLIPLPFTRFEKESMEYIGVTSTFIYAYHSWSDETTFVLYKRGSEFIFVGKLVGDRVVLDRKVPYRSDGDESQCGVPGETMFSQLIIGILVDQEKDRQQKEDSCRKVLNDFISISTQARSDGKPFPVEISSVKVSTEILVDKKKVKLLPEALFQMVKEMKPPEKLWIDL